MFPFVLIAVGLVLALSSNDSSEDDDACDTSINSLPEPLRTAARDAAINGKDATKLQALAKMLRDNGKTRAAECIEARALVVAALAPTDVSPAATQALLSPYMSRLPAALRAGFAPSMPATPAATSPLPASPPPSSDTSGDSYLSNAATEMSAPLEMPKYRIGEMPDKKG